MQVLLFVHASGILIVNGFIAFCPLFVRLTAPNIIGYNICEGDYTSFGNGACFYLFKIGDNVFYPLHGVGVIESIETHSVLGVESSYYILRFSGGRMTAMVPVETSEEIGLRPVITAEEYERIMEYLETTEGESDYDNWNQRYRENMDKLKSGNIFQAADVVLSLRKREKAKGGLSSGEKKMLITARQVLLGELMCASGKSEEDFISVLGE